MTEADVMDPESGVSVKRDGSTLEKVILRDCEQRRMKGNDKWKEWCVWAQAAHFPVGDCHGRGKEKGRDLRSEGDGKIVNM
ncbi:hypothetical protein V6N11_022223 [Hibiscus sabdariffa]|uniref:Uncharacterized protein n=1 Tax=Hibiscus sabdariffa TaxID=183260 RepID=A0ABR2TJ54_9ROSI